VEILWWRGVRVLHLCLYTWSPSCLSASDTQRDGSDNSCVGGKDDDDQVMMAMRWCVFMRVVRVNV
jgi:hypothetical protein